MILRSLKIKNYRSLEDVSLDEIDHFNVLIGRNNSGKSSVFGALQLLVEALAGREPAGGWSRVLYRLDATRSLEMELVFEPCSEKRRQFIRLTRLSGSDPAAFERLVDSQLLSRISYLFRSPTGNLSQMHLREIKVTAEGGGWAVVQRMTGHETVGNPSFEILRFDNLGEAFPHTPLYVPVLDIDQVRGLMGFSMVPEYNIQSIPFQTNFSQDRGSTWLREGLMNYLGNAFFFDPFRHSEQELAVMEEYRLSQTGGNLARVLNTLNNNDRDKFEEIEAFAHGALPDIGRLQPFLSSNQTRVEFRSSRGEYKTRLHEMGGGVEQLLMAAVVLLTTGDESS
ncbi:MAG: AAA family ATPase, partial [Actinomycetota bacterium]|nr:AAA family ATPase [Actinomycetota bacterium]